MPYLVDSNGNLTRSLVSLADLPTTELTRNQIAYVDRLPTCDVCRHDVPDPTHTHAPNEAEYDARFPNSSTWAYLCARHADEFGIILGTGYGQRLVLRTPENVEAERRRREYLKSVSFASNYGTKG